MAWNRHRKDAKKQKKKEKKKKKKAYKLLFWSYIVMCPCVLCTYVPADFKDDEAIDNRENPESIEEEDPSDKAYDDESNIQDDSDDDVNEEEEAEEVEEEKEGKEEDSDDPWRLLIEQAFERWQSEFDERVTKHMARRGGC